MAEQQRPKIIRDAFSIPEHDYRLIADIKARALRQGVDTNKSEIVRAGLKLLAGLNQGELKKALAQVEKVKPGRPKGKR